MKLLVTTPLSIVLNAEDVRHVRAEDETGAFGILPGHADFVTVLNVSVITWLSPEGGEHHIVVRGGVLTVREGRVVEVATREAIGEDTLHQLGSAVLEQFQKETEAEKESRLSGTRLHLAAIRRLQRYVASGRQIGPFGPSSSLPMSAGVQAGEGEIP